MNWRICIESAEKKVLGRGSLTEGDGLSGGCAVERAGDGYSGRDYGSSNGRGGGETSAAAGGGGVGKGYGYFGGDGKSESDWY